MLLQNLKQGLRALRREPSVSLLAILTLALGIGATTTIFTVVNAVLFSPLPYNEPSELVRVYATKPDQGIERSGLAGADFVDFSETLDSFEHLGSYRWFGLALGEERPRELATILLTPGLLAELAPPILGRTFTPEEGQPGEGYAIVLSHALWQSEFGGDEGVVGRTQPLDGREYTIVGVMPEGFSFPAPGIEVWAPRTFDRSSLSRDNHSWNVIGRLAPGVSVEAANEELRTAAGALEEQFPDSNAGWSAFAVPLHEQVVGAARPALMALLLAVGLVLAIACANVANLLLARGIGRQQEMALRLVLGAGRGRLVRQLLTESLLLAGIGGLLGIGLAYVGVRSLIRLEPDGLPRVSEIAVNGQVLGFALLVTLLTGLAFGILPALRGAGRELGHKLRDGGRSAVGLQGGQRLRGAITVAQIALSLVLLVGAGLMLRSFLHLVDVDSGFQPERRAALQLFVYGEKYRDPEQQRQFYDRLIEELEALPGVRSAAGINTLPLSPIGGGRTPIHVLGRAEPEDIMLGYRIVTEGYFDTMGTNVRAGRAFNRGDGAESAQVALLNEAAARRFFPQGDAVGSFLRGDSDDDRTEIVGIVGDVRHQGLEQDPVPEIFLPFQQNVTGTMSVVVETEGDPSAHFATLQERVWVVDPGQPIWGTVTLDTLVEQDTAQERLQSSLVSLFAAVALILAAVGLYGVLSYAVAQRRREIGVRMAVGANTSQILNLVLRSGSRLVGSGLAVGLLLAMGLVALFSRLLAPLLFGIEAQDPSTFLTAGLLMAIVGLFACLAPALRASQIDPNKALSDD
ncbi:MAG: ABC transporter permease [Acidobacteriota bacterium]